MRNRTLIAVAVVVAGLWAVAAPALHMGKDIVVPAASRGTGSGGSLWATALYVTNPGSTAASLRIEWLVRGQANPNPLAVTVPLAAGATLVREDAILELFGITAGNGALRVVSDQNVVVNATVLNRAGGVEFGQGSEGVPVEAAIKAGATTHIAGLKHTSAFRTNLYLANAGNATARATVTLLGADGVPLHAKSYTLGAWMPVLESMATFGAASYTNGTLRVEVTEGALVAGASRVNNSTGDPITLSAWWDLGSSGGCGGFAPGSVVGAHARVTVLHTGTAAMIHDVVVTSATAGTFSDFGSTVAFTYSGYTPEGDVATMQAQIPAWNMTINPLIFVWTSAHAGYLVGHATSSIGPEIVSGSFEGLPQS